MLITRHKINSYKFLLILILLVYIGTKKSFSHECILKDTTPKEITIYNACKADLKKRAPSTDLNNSLLKVKIKELKSENKNLKNQLLDLKIRLNSLLQRLESYLN